ncbi:uncharacterized protein LOC121989633 isoform X6 [Zingiber officinale]|uniref:uncharacterized protein LOC121989633 isoform X6 n=1 Tax=Zingiber officinale TaxID=94328 RepID=UPI001C4BD064|nr:uncharacterized protein LOC121989633 isoform X6 [Zingiber officinale]
MDPKKSGNCVSKDDSARTNIDESLANVDPILVTDYNKISEQANDRADQTSGIAGQGISIFTMLKDTRSKGDRTNKIGGKNDSSVINCSTYLFGASEIVPTITHANEASFHNLRVSPVPEDNNDAAYIQAYSRMEGMLPLEILPHNPRDGSLSIDTIGINAKFEDCDSHAGVALALHTKTNLSPEMSSNSYKLEVTSPIKGDKNVEVERVSGCTLEIQEIFSGATCISQSVSVPVESFDPIRLYVSDKEAAGNSVVAEQTVDNSGVARQYEVDSLEASLKSLQFGLEEGRSVPPSPITRGLIQELASPNLLMKQHNRLDSHNEECANFLFGLENKSSNDSSGNTFKKTSTLGTEDESESAKSNIDNKYKHFNKEEKLLASSSKRRIMSYMTKDQVASSNFAPPYTGYFLRFSRKKLIVLDLNGLLADINRGNARTAHKRVGGKSVFKRPFCDNFLKFCFERFNVGVWSSRGRNNMDPVVDYLMGDLKHKLLFCWDQSKCTHTGRGTLDNIHKPLFLKELNKLWNKDEPDLPWEKGEYSASNTLLIDDSPYKAICNPPHTAIFPDPYRHPPWMTIMSFLGRILKHTL